MSEQVQIKEKIKSPEVSSVQEISATERSEVFQVEGKGWKRWLPAICCGAPLLLLAAITLFGASLTALASGLLSLAAVLACPLGMYFMMRMMMKNKK